MDLFLNRLRAFLSGLHGSADGPGARTPDSDSPGRPWDYETENEVPHECGHAAVAWLSPAVFMVDRIYFLPGGGARTLLLMHRSRSDVDRERLVYTLGGIAGETLMWQRVRGRGLASDLRTSVRLAKAVLERMTIQDLEKAWGARVADSSLDVASMLVRRPSPEIAAVMNLCYRRAKFLLNENKAGFLRLCEAARGRRDLTREDIKSRFGPRLWGSS